MQYLRGDWEGLLETLGTLYHLNPGEHSLLMEMADAHRRLGQYELALSALGRYVEQFPEDYTGHVQIARIDRRRGKPERARGHLGRAMIIAPTLSDLAAEELWLDEASRILAPVEIAQDRFSDIDIDLEAGRDRYATLLLDTLQSQLPPALADFHGS